MVRVSRLVKIAWRNIFRNKRRSLLTLTILVTGSVGMILVGGFLDNIIGGLREQFIHSQTGHLQINAQGYYENGSSDPFKYLIKDSEPLQKRIEAAPHVLFTVPRLKFAGMISSNNTSIAVMALGVDPERERRMGDVKYRDAKYPSTHIAEGKDLDPKEPYGVVLGKGLMKTLKLKVGDHVSFITTREAGSIDGAEFQVRGSFETIFKDFDDRAMKMDIKTAQNILDLKNELHSLLVILDQTENTSAVQADLTARFKTAELPLESISWEEQGIFYRLSKDLLLKINSTIQIIITVIFFFSIANTINMSLFERMREFGTMMAMGNSRATIFFTIFLEGSILGLIGSCLGLAFGIALAHIISAVGIEMPPPPMGSYGYYAMISLSPALLAKVFLISLASALVSTVFPGFRASHFRIVEALGYV